MHLAELVRDWIKEHGKENPYRWCSVDIKQTAQIAGYNLGIMLVDGEAEMGYIHDDFVWMGRGELLKAAHPDFFKQLEKEIVWVLHHPDTLWWDWKLVKAISRWPTDAIMRMDKILVTAVQQSEGSSNAL